jgi:hypothetical protein
MSALPVALIVLAFLLAGAALGMVVREALRTSASAPSNVGFREDRPAVQGRTRSLNEI